MHIYHTISAIVGNWNFPVFWVDVSGLHVSFAGIFIARNGLSLTAFPTVWSQLQACLITCSWDPSVLHVVDMAKPVQAPL